MSPSPPSSSTSASTPHHEKAQNQVVIVSKLSYTQRGVDAEVGLLIGNWKGLWGENGNGGVINCQLMMIGMGSNRIAEDDHPLDDVVFICLFIYLYIKINK
jgi:hypothetical protein